MSNRVSRHPVSYFVPREFTSSLRSTMSMGLIRGGRPRWPDRPPVPIKDDFGTRGGSHPYRLNDFEMLKTIGKYLRFYFNFCS